MPITLCLKGFLFSLVCRYQNFFFFEIKFGAVCTRIVVLCICLLCDICYLHYTSGALSYARDTLLI